MDTPAITQLRDKALRRKEKQEASEQAKLDRRSFRRSERRQRIRDARHVRREAIASGQFIIVTARHGCGCCEAKMRFYSVESAHEAFRRAGLESCADIKDDLGDTHESIDTFYGFHTDNTMPTLGDLIERAFGKVI